MKVGLGFNVLVEEDHTEPHQGASCAFFGINCGIQFDSLSSRSCIKMALPHSRQTERLQCMKRKNLNVYRLSVFLQFDN